MKKFDVYFLEGNVDPQGRRDGKKLKRAVEKGYFQKTGRHISIGYVPWMQYVNDKQTFTTLRRKFRNKKSLEAFAKELAPLFPDGCVLVGHSTGGILVKILEQKLGIKTKGVILLATPNKGINLALRERLLMRFVSGIIPPIVEEIRAESKVLRELDTPKDYYYLRGKKDVRVSRESGLGPGKCFEPNTDHRFEVNTEAVINQITEILIEIITA